MNARLHGFHQATSPHSQTHPGLLDMQLDDTTQIRMRPARPTDRERFELGFLELSDETRYCRCFVFRNTLTEGELDMLCNADGIWHVALVALSLDHNGEERDSIGGARFFVSESDPALAEMAFLVMDAWQGRCLGLQLVATLVNIAQSRGIQRLRCYLLPNNIKARRLLRQISELTGWALNFDEEGALLSSAMNRP